MHNPYQTRQAPPERGACTRWLSQNNLDSEIASDSRGLIDDGLVGARRSVDLGRPEPHNAALRRRPDPGVGLESAGFR